MFWIHGGYLIVGKGNWYEFGYAPSLALAKKLNCVFVSINYRLTVFGFMALDLLRENSTTNSSGNYGFLDMLAGLEWVKENIHNFGGDPNEVTAFGHSSGATALIALLASPRSKGLFKNVWAPSASPVLNKTAQQAFKDNELFLNNTGCNNVTCLYALTPEEAILKVPHDEFPSWGMDDLLWLPEQGVFVGALPIIDDYVLYDVPLHVFACGNGTDVPVMIGTTAQELDYLPMPLAVLSWTWATSDYRDHVTSKLGTFGEDIPKIALSLYPENVATPECQLTTMISDIRLTCAINYVSTVLAAGMKSDVFRYIATYFTKDQPAKPFGTDYPVHYAYHGIDILAFFDTMDLVLPNGTGPQDIAWRDNVQNEIMTFARTGKPKTAEWLPYPDIIAELDTNTTVSHCYHAPHCEFWLHNGFFSYAWIN